MGQRNQKLSPPSTTTCALSSNQTTQCPKRASKLNSSQVSRLTMTVSPVFKVTVTYVVSSVLGQTKMSAPRRTAAVNMSVSTPLGATAVSAGVVLFCMRTNMTVKKVFLQKKCLCRKINSEHQLLFLNSLNTSFLIDSFYSWL